MSQFNSLIGAAIAIAVTSIPNTALAQAHDANGHSHAHSNMAVDCTNLATPPSVSYTHLTLPTILRV